MARKHKKEPLQMAEAEQGWFDGEKIIPFSKMNNKYLKNAKLNAQRKELFYHNRASLFSELVEQLEAEALRRGFELPDYKSDFHTNSRKLKDHAKRK